MLTDTKPPPDVQFTLSFLSHLLLGTSASPLHKALVDAGLGSSVIGGGMDDDLLQPTFSVGLRDARTEDRDAVAEVVLRVLRHHAEHGFDAAAVEATVNTLEFGLRERNTGHFPRGLAYMLSALSQWIYDGDPYLGLKYEEALQACANARAPFNNSARRPPPLPPPQT